MRMSRRFIIAVLLMSMMAMLLPASVAVADDVVTFTDPNLDAAVRLWIGKSTGDIRQSDLDAFSDFQAVGKGITDLTGLEHWTSLEKLNIAVNQIGNISPLSSLINLTWLWASVNQISDLSPLANLTNLVHLELYQNNISDVSPLANLTKLDFLWMHNNDISDISSLADLTNIAYLFSYDNEIGNISILSNFTKLNELDIRNNNITDIWPLVDNPGLSAGDEVYLSGNPLSTVSIDDYIPQLEERGVDVNYNYPTDPGEGEGCFIATAAYGTSTAQELDTLRAFRDEVMLESTLGSELVEWYYQTSPPVADFISESSLLRTIVRELAIDPLVGVIKTMQTLWRD